MALRSRARKGLVAVEGAWDAAAKRRALRDVAATLAIEKHAETLPVYVACRLLATRLFLGEVIRA